MKYATDLVAIVELINQPNHRVVLSRDGRRHHCRPGAGIAFGVFPSIPVLGGFAGVELSDIRGPRVGREVVQVVGGPSSQSLDRGHHEVGLLFVKRLPGLNLHSARAKACTFSAFSFCTSARTASGKSTLSRGALAGGNSPLANARR